MTERKIEPHDAAALSGIPLTLLRTWARTGLVVPSQRSISGSHGRYTPDDIWRLRVAKVLREEAGLSVHKVKKILPRTANALRRAAHASLETPTQVRPDQS